MRVLAVDFGSKRIGLSVGDTEFRVASPRAALPSVEGLAGNARLVLEAASNEEVDAIVVGVPLGPEGEETAMAKVCRKLIAHISGAGAKVFEVDESLSSVGAETVLRQHDWTAAQRKAHLDSEAASQILERFFAEYGQEG